MGKELYNTYPVAKAVFIEGSDILPDSYAGHSVGEYAAPACSGAMRFEDGLSLIRRRGQLMQKVSDDMGDGGMLVLASDYVEAVSKIFSMMKTTIKSDNYYSGRCSGY